MKKLVVCFLSVFLISTSNSNAQYSVKQLERMRGEEARRERVREQNSSSGAASSGNYNASAKEERVRASDGVKKDGVKSVGPCSRNGVYAKRKCTSFYDEDISDAARKPSRSHRDAQEKLIRDARKISEPSRRR